MKTQQKIIREYDMDQTQKKTHQKKALTARGTDNGKKRALVNAAFVAGTVLCVCVILLVMMNLPKSNDGGNGHAEDETQKIVVTQAQQYQAAENVYLDQKTGTARLNISNDASNAVSIQVIIALKDGDILYTSDDLEPGTVLSEIQLDCDLEKGEYDIEISVDSYSLDQHEMVGGIVYERKLFVD
jgi:competence protein ComGC